MATPKRHVNGTQASASSRMLGYAGPPPAETSEVYSESIVVDKHARAVQGMKAEDAVRRAAGEPGKIYG